MADVGRSGSGVSTYGVIAPILRGTYGDGSMVAALAEHLSELIERNDWDERGREWEIMLVCWNWFPGGTTAEGVARKIEEALNG